jgi:phosphoglycolate phosphatase
MKAALLLDFDGTLADTSSGIYWSFSTAASHCGLKPPSLEELRSAIGPPIGILFDKYYAYLRSDSADTRQSFITCFRSHYDQVGFLRLDWYKNVDLLFSWLSSRSIDVAVVTNKPTEPTKTLLCTRGFDQNISAIVGIDALAHKGFPAFPSKADAIIYACHLIDCSVVNSLYVGDTLSDRTASKEAGVNFVAATYGFHPWSEIDLSEITHVASIEELLDNLERFNLPARGG